MGENTFIPVTQGPCQTIFTIISDLDLWINADHEKPCKMVVNNDNLKCHKKSNPFPGDQKIALSKDYNPKLGSFSIDSCLISLA